MPISYTLLAHYQSLSRYKTTLLLLWVVLLLVAFVLAAAAQLTLARLHHVAVHLGGTCGTMRRKMSK